MNDISTLGIDLGKNTFHLCGMSRTGRLVLRQQYSRSQLLRQLSLCAVAMEACGGRMIGPGF